MKYAQTFTATGGLGNYTFTLSPPNPSGLTLSATGSGGATTATLSGTPTTYGSFPPTLQLTDGTNTVSHCNYTLAISATALSILTTSLPNATVGVGYAASLTATGGTPPYSWAVTGNGLPAGLNLTASGVGSGAISGSPGSAGTSTFGVTVTDSLGSTASTTLSISISPFPLTFTTTSPLPPTR